MKINSETLRLLGYELPWATKYLPKNEGDFFVKIMDLNVLGLRGDSVYLIDKFGEEITVAHGFWGAESVEKAIRRIGDRANDVYYILDYDYHQKSLFTYSIVVTIYKIPKDAGGMRAWLNQKKTEFSNEIREVLRG